ncbi:MAG: hypothetical protein EXR54_10530 [Dehalococcoidia bacterium]|nr:hypothetical protein [Dehalococcoidia bacterium]MSQ17962.1 hypothetical protein [Dehalococcoidia bacterium]
MATVRPKTAKPSARKVTSTTKTRATTGTHRLKSSALKVKAGAHKITATAHKATASARRFAIAHKATAHKTAAPAHRMKATAIKAKAPVRKVKTPIRRSWLYELRNGWETVGHYTSLPNSLHNTPQPEVQQELALVCRGHTAGVLQPGRDALGHGLGGPPPAGASEARAGRVRITACPPTARNSPSLQFVYNHNSSPAELSGAKPANKVLPP